MTSLLKNVFAFLLASITSVHASELKERALRLLNSPSDEIIFCTRPLANCHLMYATFGNYADEFDKSIYPDGGSAIKALNLKTGATRVILEDKTGSFRDVRVSYDGKNFVEPTYANAKNKSYPVVRPLYFYYTKDREAKVKAFIDYVMSAEGQKWVKEVGYIDVL